MTSDKNPSSRATGSTTDMGPYTIVPAWVASVLQPGPLALYVHLGLHADRGGTAFPSQARLAEAIGCSVDTVKRYVAALKDAGVLSVAPRKRANGSQTSNLYVLATVPPEAHETGGCTDAPPCTHAPPGGGTHAPPTTLNKNQMNQRPAKPASGKFPKAQRDAMWDALAASCGFHPSGATMTHSERTNIGKSVNELLAAGATPVDVRERALIFRRRYPKITLTHTALRNRWSELAPTARQRSTATRSGPIIEV